MEYVEALKDKKEINALQRYFKKHSERDYMLFVLGINTGLKITELLNITVGEVLKKDGVVKDFYSLRTKAMKAPMDIYLNPKVKKAILHYVKTAHLRKEEYLFQSTKTPKPITRQQAYRIICQAAEKVGIKGKIGTNSLRKTFGYHAYKQGVAISFLQKHFHHSCSSETYKYLGINKDKLIKTEIDVNL